MGRRTFVCGRVLPFSFDQIDSISQRKSVQFCTLSVKNASEGRKLDFGLRSRSQVLISFSGLGRQTKSFRTELDPSQVTITLVKREWAPLQRSCLIVQDNAQEGSVDVKTAIVPNEA